MTRKIINGHSPIEGLFEAFFEQSINDMQVRTNEMPSACPLDLLTDIERKELQEIIDGYETLAEVIDPHYVALLIALSQYEDVDIYAKVNEHIIENLLKKD